MSHNNLWGPTWQGGGKPVQNSMLTIQTDSQVKSLKETFLGCKIRSMTNRVESLPKREEQCSLRRSQPANRSVHEAVSVLWPLDTPTETWPANCLRLHVSAADQQALSPGSWTGRAGSTPGDNYWGPQGPIRFDDWLSFIFIYLFTYLFVEGAGHCARFKIETSFPQCIQVHKMICFVS